MREGVGVGMEDWTTGVGVDEGTTTGVELTKGNGVELTTTTGVKLDTTTGVRGGSDRRIKIPRPIQLHIIKLQHARTPIQLRIIQRTSAVKQNEELTLRVI